MAVNEQIIIDLNKSLVELSGKIEIMVNSVNAVSSRIDEVAEDVSNAFAKDEVARSFDASGAKVSMFLATKPLTLYSTGPA